MNNKFKILIFIYIIFSTILVKAEFLTTYSINSKTVGKINQWIDKDTIIFIEIDDVLVMPKSKMFSYDANPYRMFINNLISYGKKTPEYNKSVARWYAQREIKLVEKGWLDFIEKARIQGAKIYGICSMPLHLTNIEERRLRELKKLGIVFDTTINGQEEFLITPKSRWASRFYNGIIFTASHPKSKTILELIKVTNLSPEKILTFGSIKHEVKSVDNMLRRFNMYFKNILYLGTREIRGHPDSEIVKFQQKQLIQNGKWYEDEQVEKLLKK